MRVLHVVASARRRGAEVFAADLVGALNGAGVEQAVVILDPEGAAVSFEAPVHLLEPSGKRLPALRADTGILRGLRSVISEWRPDLIQGHGGDTLKYGLLAARRHPVVHRAIGMAPPWIARGPRRVAYSLLMRRAARVVPLADAVGREVIDVFGVAPNRVVTIMNAVDVGRMNGGGNRGATRRKLGLPDRVPVILSLAALTWEKDPLAHLDVTSRVLRNEGGAIHLFVGDGPMRREVEAEIAGRGMGEHVRLLGARDDIPDLLAASDLVLFASRPDGMEGLPTILIEAGMANRPVVGYALAGVREVVLDGVTGRLAEPGRPEALAELALALLRDGGERRRLGEAARRRCLDAFEIGVVAPQYIEVYKSVLDERRPEHASMRPIAAGIRRRSPR